MMKKTKIRTFKKCKKTEKVAWLFLLFLVVVFGALSYWRYTEYKEKQRIVSIFDNTISDYIKKMKNEVKDIEGLDLHFLPENISIFPYEMKKNPVWYKEQLKLWFTKTIDIYNSHVENHDILRVELDIKKLIKRLSPNEKISQLFIFWIHGKILDTIEKEFLEKTKIWGVIFMGENIGTDEEVLWLTSDIQKTNRQIPLFIAIDQEWWTVKRVLEDLPAQGDLTTKNVCKTYQSRGALLEKLWINVNFGIVADTTEDKTSFIYPRVFHKEKYTLLGEAVRCTTGTLSTIKHFPGHGAVKGNTHLWIQTIYKSCEDMEKEDMSLFSSWFDAGNDFVMMGHLLLPCKDKKLPATLSQKHIQTAREMWFQGLIITDDMHMIDTNYERKEALKLWLLSGEDILLYVDKTSRRQEILDYAQKLYHEGILTKKMIDTHLQRIFEAKNKIMKKWKYIHKTFYKR